MVFAIPWKKCQTWFLLRHHYELPPLQIEYFPGTHYKIYIEQMKGSRLDRNANLIWQRGDHVDFEESKYERALLYRLPRMDYHVLLCVSRSICKEGQIQRPSCHLSNDFMFSPSLNHGIEVPGDPLIRRSNPRSGIAIRPSVQFHGLEYPS